MGVSNVLYTLQVPRKVPIKVRSLTQPGSDMICPNHPVGMWDKRHVCPKLSTKVLNSLTS